MTTSLFAMRVMKSSGLLSYMPASGEPQIQGHGMPCPYLRIRRDRTINKGSARPKRFNEPPRGGHRVLLYCLVGDDGVVYSRLAKRGEPLLATGDWPHENNLVYHAILNTRGSPCLVTL